MKEYEEQIKLRAKLRAKGSEPDINPPSSSEGLSEEEPKEESKAGTIQLEESEESKSLEIRNTLKGQTKLEDPVDKKPGFKKAKSGKQSDKDSSNSSSWGFGDLD